jgi:hypothetical protein
VESDEDRGSTPLASSSIGKTGPLKSSTDNETDNTSKLVTLVWYCAPTWRPMSLHLLIQFLTI